MKKIPPSPLTLEYVAAQFKKWRKRKKMAREQVPEDLWKLVRQLKNKYEASKIATALNLNSSQMRRQGLSDCLPKSSVNNAFINVALPFTTFPTITSPTISVERKDGVKITFANPSTEQVAFLFKSFME
jgi:hypothetical protein